MRDVDRLFAVYLHLQTIGVSPGQAVTRGQPIGAMGQTGDTDFVHLHFEIRLQTMCSLPYQREHPDAGCVTGFDPHVHPRLVIPASNAIAMFLGAAIAALMRRYTRAASDRYVVPVASGLIAGESLAGIAIAMLIAGGVIAK